MTPSAYSLQQATEWYIQLTSGQSTESDIQAWTAWRGEQPENEQAWKTVEAATQRFSDIDKTLGLSALAIAETLNAKIPSSANRRQILKHLGVFLAVGASGALAYRTKPWQQVLADYRTGVGEQKKVLLEDGTKMMLNSDSLVDVHFSNTKRVLSLLKGEILIESGHDAGKHYRPLSVTTSDGSVTALGTRFTTRKHDGFTSVNLYSGALDILPSQSFQKPHRLNATESITFNSNLVLDKAQMEAGSDAWSTGFLVVDNMRLGDFIEELSRYKTGSLRCDPQIADLSISGAYPIKDIDAILISITQRLPIRIESFTRYWVQVKPI